MLKKNIPVNVSEVTLSDLSTNAQVPILFAEREHCSKHFLFGLRIISEKKPLLQLRTSPPFE